MNPKTTWRLILLTAALFTFIVFVESRLPPGDRSAHSPDLLLPALAPQSVSAIEILRSNQIVRVERLNQTWFLCQPKRAAQPVRVESFLKAVAALRRNAVFTVEELVTRPHAAAEFGLSPPQASAILDQPSGRIELLLGHRVWGGDQVYVQLVGTPGIFFADAALWNALPGADNDWRDPTFLPLKGQVYDRLDVRSQAPHEFSLVLNPTNQLWRLARPMDARADNVRVKFLLQRLLTAEVSRFLTDAPGVDLAGLGLQPPVLELTFARATNAVLTARFGRSPTNESSLVYASTSVQTNVVLVSRDLLTALQVPFREFQDRQLAAFAPFEVGYIEVQGRQSFALERSGNGAWHFREPVRARPDHELVDNLLQQLLALRVAQFEKDVVTDQDFANFGLLPPALRYTLHRTPPRPGSPSPAPLAQLDLGSATADRVYARRTDENSLYAIALHAVQKLATSRFQVRDRRLWDFPPTNVVSLTLYRKGQTRKVVRNASREWILPPMFQGRLNPLVVDPLLQKLGELRAEAWIAETADRPVRYGFQLIPNQLTVEVVSGDQTSQFTVDFGGPAASGNTYASTTIEGQPVIFELPSHTFELYEILAHDLFEGLRVSSLR